MCKIIEETPNLAPGWVCCGCRCYNGNQRAECKHCGHTRCTNPLPEAAPESTSTWVLSKEDTAEFAKDLTIAGEAIARILLRYEGSPSLKGLSLVETLQAFLASSVLEASGGVFKQIAEIATRLPIWQEAQALGLSAISGTPTGVSPFKQ